MVFGAPPTSPIECEPCHLCVPRQTNMIWQEGMRRIWINCWVCPFTWWVCPFKRPGRGTRDTTRQSCPNYAVILLQPGGPTRPFSSTMDISQLTDESKFATIDDMIRNSSQTSLTHMLKAFISNPLWFPPLLIKPGGISTKDDSRASRI